MQRDAAPATIEQAAAAAGPAPVYCLHGSGVSQKVSHHLGGPLAGCQAPAIGGSHLQRQREQQRQARQQQ